jgi:hypothetical protein
MRLFNFYIDEQLDAQLEAESGRTGLPMAEITRKALTIYLRGVVPAAPEQRPRGRASAPATRANEGNP